MRDDLTGDALLGRLGELAREERLDARLEALAAGTLSPADHAALVQEAAADPELAAAIEAFTPLGDAAQSRIADRLLSQVIPKASSAKSVEGARVLPFRRPLARVLLAVVPLAAAAALAFFLLRPEAPVGAPVPGYGLTIEGGEKALRSDTPAEGPPRLLPETRLRLVLTPATPTEGAVGVRAWKVRQGQAEPWAVAAQVAPNGAARVEGTARTLGLAELPPGRATLVLAIGREASLPPVDAPASALTAPAADAPYRLLSTEVEILAP